MVLGRFILCHAKVDRGWAKGRWEKKADLVTRALPGKSHADPSEVMSNPVMRQFDGFPYRCCQESSGMLRLESVPGWT